MQRGCPTYDFFNHWCGSPFNIEIYAVMKCLVHMTIMLYEYLGELKDMRFIEGRGIKQLHGVSSSDIYNKNGNITIKIS
ncbi:hypothetical protein DWZ56_13615 [Lachnotalea sp. AF33-28]|nr:hypothetical protein DWZ56_13615 [Lachnotalea sp. AF33-28]